MAWMGVIFAGSKNLAGWPGPESGSKWSQIQLAAHH